MTNLNSPGRLKSMLTSIHPGWLISCDIPLTCTLDPRHSLWRMTDISMAWRKTRMAAQMPMELINLLLTWAALRSLSGAG